MSNKEKSAEDINTIRRIMEESSRFLSLSGFSGLFSGLIAIAGWAVANFLILGKISPVWTSNSFASSLESIQKIKTIIIIDSLLVLILAVSISVYFSYKKSLQQGVKIWTPLSKRMLVNLIIPLVSGGLFILILYNESQWQLIVPSMLMFYGLALVNASKFTYSEVFYLGLIEILIGLGSSLFPSSCLLFWVVGFGLLHIVYGLLMYRKYDR